jgi:hypothetical protein
MLPLYLGPLITKTTLDANIMALESAEKRISQQIDAKRGEIENISDLEIELLAIHGREREYLPPNRLKSLYKVGRWTGLAEQSSHVPTIIQDEDA